MILTAADVHRTVQDVLRARLPLALAAMSAHLSEPGKPFVLRDVACWERLPDFMRISERQSPAVVVTTPKLTPGTRDAYGDYTVRGDVRTFIVARGASYEETADRVAAYCAAIRLSLLADPGLNGIARGVTWLTEEYAELGSIAEGGTNRTVGAGSVTVRYDLDTPGTIPTELLPVDQRPFTVTSTHVDVEALEAP